MTQRFGKYVVESEIGRGGFGRVYRALDADMNRRVAVKVLSSQSDPDLLSRFQAEAGTTANLAHRNIVTVFEFAQQDGIPYLVMELLEGRTLHEIIAAGIDLPLLEKVEIMHQIACGLQHAHSRGVIHRDIKPGNIMVLSDGAVKIMDFGIARMMHGDAVRRTHEGDLIGTVSYMAPEMFHNHEPDKKTDIFAYGVLYYELTTGQHPFQSKDPYTAMRRIMSDDPVPLGDMLVKCPEGLELLVHHLITKDRDTRFDDFSDVLFDTEPLLRQLRQDRAAELTKELEPLINGENFEKAYARVREILELDPGQKEARLWRDQIRKRVNRQRANRLLQQGTGHMSSSRFKEAINCFESALQLDTSRTELLALLSDAKTAIERIRRAGELCVSARADQQRGHIEAAFSKASEAAQLDPANQEACLLRDSLSRQLREFKVATGIAKSSGLLQKGLFEEASAILDELDSDLQRHSDVIKLRSQISQQRKEDETKRRIAEFQRELQTARELTQTRGYERAGDIAEQLCLKYPDQPEAFEFRTDVRERVERERRRQAVAGFAQRARALIGESKYQEARSMLADAVQLYPGEPILENLVSTVTTILDTQERLQNIQRVLERADMFAEEGNLDRALELVDKAVGRLGEDPMLLDLRRHLQQRRTQQQYSLTLEKTLAETQSLADAGQPRRALGLLESAASKFGNEPRFATLLEQIREKAREEDERIFVDQLLKRVRLLESEERYLEALNEIAAAPNGRRGKSGAVEAMEERLRKSVEEQKRERILRTNAEQVEAAIALEDWTLAIKRLEAVQTNNPNQALLSSLTESICAGQRRTNLRNVETAVKEALDRDDFRQAEDQLTRAKEAFSEESIWISLQDLLQERREYCQQLALAEQLSAEQNYGESKRILETIRKTAPDGRANRHYEAVCRELHRIELEERERRAQEEDAGRRRAEAISRGISAAREFAAKGNIADAQSVLERLVRQYPDFGGEQKQLASQFTQLYEEEQRLRREREDRNRRDREAAFTSYRNEAAGLLAAEDFAGALAKLSDFERKWGDSASARTERERLIRALEQQREEQKERANREAEERASRHRQEEIEKIRAEVSECVKAGDFARAISQLKLAAKRFPDIPEFRDRQQAVLHEQERRKTEESERARRAAAEQTRRKRDTAIAEGRQKAVALAREGNLSGAVGTLERLSKQYPNSSEVRQALEMASSELLHQKELEGREGNGKEATKKLRPHDLEKASREAIGLLRQGELSRALSTLTRLAKYPKK